MKTYQLLINSENRDTSNADETNYDFMINFDDEYSNVAAIEIRDVIVPMINNVNEHVYLIVQPNDDLSLVPANYFYVPCNNTHDQSSYELLSRAMARIPVQQTRPRDRLTIMNKGSLSVLEFEQPIKRLRSMRITLRDPYGNRLGSNVKDLEVGAEVFETYTVSSDSIVELRSDGKMSQAEFTMTHTGTPQVLDTTTNYANHYILFKINNNVYHTLIEAYAYAQATSTYLIRITIPKADLDTLVKTTGTPPTEPIVQISRKGKPPLSTQSSFLFTIHCKSEPKQKNTESLADVVRELRNLQRTQS